MSDTIRLEDWSPGWAQAFLAKASAIRLALGDCANRIDHIGSTSVPHLAAKPILDIQVSVADFDPFGPIEKAMATAGYRWRSDNPDLARRYFREQPGHERTHIHIRRSGSWHEQWALLFRDYMRTHPEEQMVYEELKRCLARRHGGDRKAYTAGKDDYFWRVIRQADRWASETGWVPPVSDA